MMSSLRMKEFAGWIAMPLLKEVQGKVLMSSLYHMNSLLIVSCVC